MAHDDDTAALEFARARIVQATRTGGATERRLTDAMCALLSTDEPAARAVANVLLGHCDSTYVARALGTTSLEGPVAVRGERKYLVPGRRLTRTTRTRRFDLLFDAGATAVAVEVKLGASLADLQLDDLLRVEVEQLGLARDGRLGVVVIGARQLELGAIKDPRGRLLSRGAVRWSAIIDELMAVSFHDARAQQMWAEDLLGMYLRRGALGHTPRVRPTPRMALEALAEPLRKHVDGLVGDAYTARLDADRGLRVTAGRDRAANIEIIIERRRLSRRDRRVTVWLEAHER